MFKSKLSSKHYTYYNDNSSKKKENAYRAISIIEERVGKPTEKEQTFFCDYFSRGAYYRLIKAKVKLENGEVKVSDNKGKSIPFVKIKEVYKA